jgi:hypothetical protein
VIAPQVQVVSLYVDQTSGFASELPGLNEGFQLGDLGHFVARKYGAQCSDLTPIFIGMHLGMPRLSPMKECSRAHHFYGSYAPSTYGS